jgi:hypothetical protein
VSADELSPEARAELDALDRVLARERIGEEHLELAALVESVRAQAPAIDPAVAARLDARVARLLSRRPSLRHRGRRALAAGGLAAAAAAVALTIVITSGTLDRAAGSHGGAASSSAVSAAARARVAPRFAVAQAPSAAAAGRPRLVRSTATLELATRAPSLLRLADSVVVVTDREGGIVASSATTVAGTAGRAHFSLQVPSGRLALEIAGLASLARVRGLTEVTSDITSGYDRVRSVLARRRSERIALTRRLARMASTPRALALRRNVATLDALISADARRESALGAEARTAALNVAVVATPNG